MHFLKLAGSTTLLRTLAEIHIDEIRVYQALGNGWEYFP
jgi:hypothetical protein